MIERDLIISGRKRDLGGFSVVRAIPSAQRRHVGPFVFLDHLGPMKIDETHLLDVRPHPHIGLSTVTYLFEGRGYHRDSLGSQQVISPGDLNWMTAGKGIVHSERTPEEDRVPNPGNFIHGIQVWVALPIQDEECEPGFTHYSKNHLPTLEITSGLSGKLLIGSYKNIQSPVKIFSRTFFADLECQKDISIELNLDEEEIGIFLIAGKAKINGQDLAIDDLMLVKKASAIQLEASLGTKFILIGGTAFPEPRYIWWNFISSSKDRIKTAAQLWKNQKMGQVPGETDFIPLPSDPMP